jgi:phosphatidylglycerol:prolipoprotein diacylglycerol transferase
MILLVIALWTGLLLAERRSESHGIPRERLSSFVFFELIAFVLGGRLAFALENLSALSKSPLDILSLSPSLFDARAAALIALAAAALHLSRQKLSIWSWLDALTPLFATLMIGMALSHLAAGTAYGAPARLPWGLEMRNAARHPSQLYELSAALLIFGVAWMFGNWPRRGLAFLTFAALTSAARLFLEAFRGDSLFVGAGLRSAQLIAWFALAASLALFELRAGKPLEE